MKRLIAFFVKYTVWANVLMLSVFVFGLIFLSDMRYSFFPETESRNIAIQVPFPGASPEEVEEGVVLKIEESIDGLEGIERITSISRENIGTINIEVLKGYDVEKVLTDVKNAVDRINSFPQDSEKPIIFEQDAFSRAVEIVVYGQADLYNMKVIAEELRDRLLATPEISQVRVSGVPNLEFSIELSEANMRRYGLTFSEVSNQIGAANVNISGGKFETEGEEILIRAYGRNYFANELKSMVIRGRSDGQVIRLQDIATITEKWEDVPDRVYYNGQKAVVLNVEKTLDEDIIAVRDKAFELVDEFNLQNGQVQAVVWVDQTVSLRQRLDLLTYNGLFGFFLVVVILGFFLNLRLSFWASIGIPFSFAGMFIIAGLVGITINVISLFGMILVVGIIVDDAIVVGENIFAHYESGKTALQAAIDGALEVVGPVFTSIATTVIAFAPFFFLDGFIGQFIWNMALVVIASLVWSLVEAFLILPAHLAHSKALQPKQRESKTRQRIEKWLNAFTYKFYQPVLEAALRNKSITLVVPVALVFITVGLVKGGFIGFTPFPFIDRDTLPINLTLVTGRQEADTDSILAEIEKAVWEVNAEMTAEREDSLTVIEGVKRDVGQNSLGESGSHAGMLTLKLLDGEARQMDSFIIANRIRDKVGIVPEARTVTFTQTSFFGRDVSVSLLGNNLSELDKARDLLVAELENFSNLKDITDSNQEGRREINIQLKPRAYALGLTLRDVAGQVRQGFFGQEIQRIQRGRDEIRVWVRYREQDRSALGFLDQMRIRIGNQEYPFTELATYSIDRGIAAIQRLDGMREIKVEASRADATEDLPPITDKVQNEVIPRVLSQVTGVRVSFEGSSRDQVKFRRSMQRAFPVAMLIMFIALILVFRSYIQAILIFGIIPLAVMCAVWGHGIQGIQINTLSIYGIIALTGIVINDSIVLVDKINRNLRDGMPIFKAVHDGAISRLRPILLTTFTTVFGLMPLIFETSRQAQFLIPMAVSVAYGILFGTFVMLLVVPAGYLVINDLRVLYARLVKKETPTPESVEPAVKEMDSPALGV
ncbi:MAG: efflux RND transporter permease subunit [Calditrichaeota bacterium]|nr:efflux RND transporter permease subunit [Calditrichota bacterium]MCB0299823.1 efflux RND transporter permease subunit [Calditrichota bacterium]MCB9066732.1 efflux RND transporter permease subunit [Calditrichia bacterium]